MYLVISERIQPVSTLRDGTYARRSHLCIVTYRSDYWMCFRQSLMTVHQRSEEEMSSASTPNKRSATFSDSCKETLLASADSRTWVKISEMFLGPAPASW